MCGDVAKAWGMDSRTITPRSGGTPVHFGNPMD